MFAISKEKENGGRAPRGTGLFDEESKHIHTTAPHTWPKRSVNRLQRETLREGGGGGGASKDMSIIINKSMIL